MVVKKSKSYMCRKIESDGTMEVYGDGNRDVHFCILMIVLTEFLN